MIDFSIIIPAYNLETYIEKTLGSICENRLDNVEVIVVDDGSTDETGKVVKKFFESCCVPNYVILTQDNKGVSSARNAGISIAKGEYIIFCDGDDLCSGDMVEQITAQKREECDMLVWRYDILQGKKRKISQKEFEEEIYTNPNMFRSFLLGENRIRLGSFAVKKMMLIENEIHYTVGCTIAEDIEFIYKCLASAKQIRTINKVLYTYVKRDGSAMHRFDWKFFEALGAIQRLNVYVRENTGLYKNWEVEEYLRNGLYFLHAMYAFNSCINYLDKWKDVMEFLQKYESNYSEIESRLKKISIEMKIIPQFFSKARIQLFRFNRKLYVYYIFLRKNKDC